LSRKHWKLLPFLSPEQLASVSFHPLIVQLLYNRGITNQSQFETFLSGDDRLQSDPFLLPDMPQAVSRIYKALLSGEKIAIYGDFDADGITATALLVQGLSALGGRAIPYIPHRFHEGYGLKLTALERLRKQGVTLVVTVDCGISAINEVKGAQKLGLDIIITDHHLPTTPLPPALAVVDPKREDSAYPFTELAGVGVAFKLLQALLWRSGREELLASLLDLVVVGTVADIAPLLGENRYLVKSGLKLLNRSPRLGLAEMIQCARLKPGNLETDDISWILGPRLNAAGRIDHAISAYRLLLTQMPEEAKRLALELEEKNSERQRITNEVLQGVRQKLVANGTESPLLMSKGENYPPGVIGIVASKLSEEFYRPVVLVKLGEEICRGSARSIPEFDLVAAFHKCRDLLFRFGGHSMAAGFTLPAENLSHFEQRLLQLAKEKLAEVDLRPHLLIDAKVPLSIFSGDTYQSIQQLAPFGCSNPTPTFLSHQVKVVEIRNLGNQGEHLGFKLRQGDITWQAVGFKLGNLASEITPYLDIVYNLEIDRWSAQEVLRLNLLDFAPSA